MATIMEKDVALEVVAGTLALVSRKFNVDRNQCFPTVETELLDMRRSLYRTPHEDVVFENIISRCQAIKAEYQNVADYSINWNCDDAQ